MPVFRKFRSQGNSCLWTSVSDFLILGDNTDETTILGDTTKGSLVLSAGMLSKPGSHLNACIRGLLTADVAAQDITFRFKIGTAHTSTFVVTPDIQTPGKPFELIFDLYRRPVDGAIRTFRRMLWEGGDFANEGFWRGDEALAFGSSIDFSTEHVFGATAQWAVSEETNILDVRYASLNFTRAPQ